MLASLGSNMYWDWTYNWRQPAEAWTFPMLMQSLLFLDYHFGHVNATCNDWSLEDSTAFVVPADLIISHMHNIQWDRICTLELNVQTLGSCTCVYWDSVTFVCDMTIHRGLNISDIDIIRSLFMFLDHHFGWCAICNDWSLLLELVDSTAFVVPADLIISHHHKRLQLLQ